MTNTVLIILLLLNFLIAFIIAKYKQANGYSFSTSFIGALIGVIGLTLLAIKGWNALEWNSFNNFDFNTFLQELLNSNCSLIALYSGKIKVCDCVSFSD
ncbi:MAG: hypothetical protein QNK84_09355 [Flavobacteriales bacterium]|mgnify:CR=1 FL=1|jgi:hypothetical protein|tara:strand:- start:4116 stop:4412 length:297 start_codon:yes stop_codon:yes gene_type:complete